MEATGTEATISEATFLLTELRYTLGQIHVQIGDLDESARGSVLCGDRSVADILREMRESEDRYQEQYASLLGVDPNAIAEDAFEAPLPINQVVTEMTGEGRTFEQRRGRTVAMLQSAGDEWSQEVRDLARKQVADDHTSTEALAECRRNRFESNPRPSLDEPLTVTEDDIIREPEPSPESVRLETTSQ
jgi:hypothetical protein